MGNNVLAGSRSHGETMGRIKGIANFLISNEGVRSLVLCINKDHQKLTVKSVCEILKDKKIHYSWHYGAVTSHNKNLIVVEVGETEAVFSIMGE